MLYTTLGEPVGTPAQSLAIGDKVTGGGGIPSHVVPATVAIRMMLFLSKAAYPAVSLHIQPSDLGKPKGAQSILLLVIGLFHKPGQFRILLHIVGSTPRAIQSHTLIAILCAQQILSHSQDLLAQSLGSYHVFLPEILFCQSFGYNCCISEMSLHGIMNSP